MGSTGVSGVKFQAGQEGRGSRRMGKGFQVSRQVEGSQHAGVAEIMSCEASFVPQLFFNSHELIVLSQTFRTARGTSLDLARAQPHHQVRDERVLSLSRAVTHHDPPAVLLGQLARLDGFTD